MKGNTVVGTPNVHWESNKCVQIFFYRKTSKEKTISETRWKVIIKMALTEIGWEDMDLFNWLRIGSSGGL
jgi:hypothetical protein